VQSFVGVFSTFATQHVQHTADEGEAEQREEEQRGEEQREEEQGEEATTEQEQVCWALNYQFVTFILTSTILFRISTILFRLCCSDL
jgi:hypothetical protein